MIIHQYSYYLSKKAIYSATSFNFSHTFTIAQVSSSQWRSKASRLAADSSGAISLIRGKKVITSHAFLSTYNLNFPVRYEGIVHY